MCLRERDHYSAFLSSVHDGLETLRVQIHHLDKRHPVWVSDFCPKGVEHIRHDSPPEDIRKLDRVCLAGVRKSDIFIWLLDSRDGRTKFCGDALRVSVMEAEVIQAVFHLKPIYLVRIKSGEPDRKLDPSVDGLVRLLKQHYPFFYDDSRERNHQDVLLHVRKVLSSLSRVRSIMRRVLSPRPLVRRLVGSTRPRFLSMVPVGPETIPLEYIESRLLDAEDTRFDYSYRLSLLWVVIRNLQSWLDADSADCPDPKIDDLLAKALRQWQSAAAWYGIHRHVGWGRFEVIEELSRRLGRNMAGAEASLHYSLARIGPICTRTRAFERVDAAIKRAKSNEPSDPTGLLLIEAHREVWSFLSKARRRRAVRLAYRALKMREKHGEPARRIGEAQVDFGHFLCLCGQLSRGIRDAREGLSKLEKGTVEPGFLIQKRRVFGICCAMALHIPCALRQWAIAHREAINFCAFDQTRWYTLLAHIMYR